jgi:cell division protein FtsW
VLKLWHKLGRRPAAGPTQSGPAGGAAVLALAGLGNGGLAARGRSSVAGYDSALVSVVTALLLFGTVMVYSASISLADSPRYTVGPAYFLLRHLTSLAFALAAAAAVCAVPIAVWQRFAPALLVITLALLVAVLVIGKGALGAKRWIPLGVFNLQPSEVMKVAAVLYAADFVVRKQEVIHRFGASFVPMAAVIAVIGGLLLMQPDLGSFGVIAAICLGVLFIGGANARLAVAVAGVMALAFTAVIALSPWRRERIFAYLDPWAPEHALGKGYQLSHSLIAFGRGEWFGVGLGGSVEKLHYLPEAHTDFILAVIGEELGLVAVLAVIVAFYWLTKRIFEIGRQAVALDRSFAGLLAQGVGLWIGVQAFINIGVATGLLPTKGLTLPLMSYGGSALLSTLTGLALVLRVDYENRKLMRGGRA